MSGAIGMATPMDWTATEPAAGAARLKETGEQFEALLLGQMMKSMREAGGSAGWLGAGEDQTASPLSECAEQQIAQLLSSQGGLGLAGIIAKGIAQKQQETETASARSIPPPK